MLWIGPPGSGKTRLCLEALETALRQGRAALRDPAREMRMVVPTAGEARRLLHGLARRGRTVPGDLILSLDELLDLLVPDLKTPSPAEADWLLGMAIEQGAADFFGPLTATRGLRRRLARTIQELQTARCDPEKLHSLSDDAQGRAVAAVYRLHERFLRSWGLVSPAERLTLAAQQAAMEGAGPIRRIDFDGFARLTPGERDLMQSLATGGVDVRITLPEAPPPGAFPRMERRELTTLLRPTTAPIIVRAAGVEQEVEEIARRILELRRQTNRPFHDFGVLLRSPALYEPAVRTSFESLGIPYRMRRPQALGAHAVGRFARKLLRAVAAGFPAEETLDALRMAASRVAAGSDRWDFAVRDRLPGVGLELLRAEAPPAAQVALDALDQAAAWRTERATAEDWRGRCARLFLLLLRPPDAPDGLTPERAMELRAHAAAGRQVVEALSEAAALLRRGGLEKIRLHRFLDVLERVLEPTELQVRDARRDVVAALDIHEARHWELPYVFVAGLVEGWFPQLVVDDLLLPEAFRKKLRKAGLEVRTRSEAQADEELLYRLALTRATEQLVLSYPAADADGAPLARSSLLPTDQGPDRPAIGGKAIRTPSSAAPVRPRIQDPRLLQWIDARRRHFSPTGLESHLQCPYQYFAARTMQLAGPPKRPLERLDPLWRGSLIHEALARWSGSAVDPIAAVIEEVFAAQPGAPPLQGAAAREAEIRFVVERGGAGEYAIQGRIDRYETLGGELALVIDYKYSGADRARKLKEAHEAGAAVQLLLYLRGLELRGLRPGGALVWTLRGANALAGWAVQPIADRFALDAEQVCTPERLGELMERAEEAAAGAVQRIRDGRIEVAPRDRDVCVKYCDFRSLCRVAL